MSSRDVVQRMDVSLGCVYRRTTEKSETAMSTQVEAQAQQAEIRCKFGGCCRRPIVSGSQPEIGRLHKVFSLWCFPVRDGDTAQQHTRVVPSRSFRMNTDSGSRICSCSNP